MDLHRYAALRRHWRRSPPLQQMVQAYLGIQPQEEPIPVEDLSDQEQADAISTFISNFAAAGGCVH